MKWKNGKSSSSSKNGWDLDDLEREIEKLQNKNSELESDNAALRQEISELQTSQEALGNDVAQLKYESSMFNEAIEDLQNQNSDISGNVETLDEKISNLEENLAELNECVGVINLDYIEDECVLEELYRTWADHLKFLCLKLCIRKKFNPMKAVEMKILS